MSSNSIPDLLTGDDSPSSLHFPAHSQTPHSHTSRSSKPASHSSQRPEPLRDSFLSSGQTTETQPPASPSAFLAYPISRVGSAANSLYRRMTDPDSPTASVFGFGTSSSHSERTAASQGPTSSGHSNGYGYSSSKPQSSVPTSSASSTVFQPPQRNASPFAPPPLADLSLTGWKSGMGPSSLILGRVLAEEIRLLVPPRLQLGTEWKLVFSVAQDGVSLSTLYGRCAEIPPSRRGGWVIVVKDGSGGVFGGFLSDAPKPSTSYYGTGECFLWRASILPTSAILASLPPPPSADTTDLTGRSTTLASPPSSTVTSPTGPASMSPPPVLGEGANGETNGVSGHPKPRTQASMSSAAAEEADMPSGVSTPDQIRFKAFPYSGVNDYLIYCEHDYLSVGGGDGKYGLWLDSNLEKGVSSPCMTFGNEGLSDEGDKFDILGVEIWFVAA